ncbi:MAG: DUF4417 domain-containing protein, partial [Ruminococcaceae bacterium]|nr:DUF4417 domain-containing protein [Oscillospiraceae bacterium]
MQIPIIPKFEERPGDFDELLLIGFDKTHLEDNNHLDRMVHFFLYDYRFERVWKNPDNDIEKLSRYRAVLSPDFSMYLEMAPVMQLYNVFRNRWCGAYWASKGIRVIPTVNWGDESTFDFCFEGIEKGSVVAVSTYMASEHDNRQAQKEWFMAGYNEMLRRIEPEKIICYNTPFPEMQGNIVYVDYERSSWRHMSYELSFRKEDLDAFKIGGTPQLNYDTIEPYLIGKGGGSAYGGEWKPKNEFEKRLLGSPGEIKVAYKKDGTKYETKIGEDGRAVRERHYSSHTPNGLHSNPHDHIINWNNPRYGVPNFGPPINYWEVNAPAFKSTWKGISSMTTIIYDNRTPEEMRFKTISDFKECIIRGGEPVFVWKELKY